MRLSKRLLLALTILYCLSILVSSVYAAGTDTTKIDIYNVDLRLEFDGKVLAPPADQKGFIYKRRVYVPLKFISNGVIKSVKWDGKTYTVTIQNPSKTELTEIVNANAKAEIKTGSVKPTTTPKKQSIVVSLKKVTYLFDGVKKTPPADQPGMIYKQRLYVPLAFFAASVGKEVQWDGKTYTVSVESSIPETQPGEGGESSTGTDPNNPGGRPVIPSPGGVSGGTTPSYESIIANVETQISSLEQRVTGELMSLVYSYIQASDSNQKETIKEQARQIIKQSDTEFYALMDSLQAQLTAGGYDTSKVASYKTQYEARKATAENALRNGTIPTTP